MLFQELPRVRLMSEMIFDPLWANNDHENNECELIYIRKGVLCQLAGGKRYRAGVGEFLITPSRTFHRDTFDLETGLEVFLIHFVWPLESEFLEYVNNSNINQVSAIARMAIARAIEEMRTDTGGGETDRMVASSRLFTVLMLFYRDLSREHGADADFTCSKRQWLVNEAKKYLDKNYRKPIKLEDIAAELSVSPFYLSRVFSQESYFSLFGYLNDVRMRKARELLREGRHIVADVAYLTGFEDSNYFSKVYKRYYGHSPSQSRFHTS